MAERVEELTLKPLEGISRRYLALVGCLLALVALGVYAYSRQLAQGLAVTGMAPTVNRVIWGLYVVNFVFFIGISHAGTLISAILRITRSRWRTPITRMAEFITVTALLVAGLFPIIDLGQPGRVLNVLRYGRWQSAILWDFLAITTYLTGSLLYLYLPLIPDLATCRDRLGGKISSLRHRLYRLLAMGWRGSPEQRRELQRGITVMMVTIVPVAVSVHTVVSWIFGMTLRPGWNSTAMGAYFVTGAIFSGVASVITVMALLRKAYRLEEIITPTHFVNLGYFLAAMGLIMVYFNLSDLLSAGYKLEGLEPLYLRQILTGSLAPFFWFYAFTLLLPGLVVLIPWTRRVGWIVFASVLVNIAMWLERYIIVVGTLRTPQMPYTSLARYIPTWVELAITAGGFALFALILAGFAKLVPVVSIWEVREHLEAARGAPGQAIAASGSPSESLGP